MMIEGLRPIYNKTLLPLGRFLGNAGISPNVITTVGILSFCVGGVLIAFGFWKTAVMLLILGSMMDGLDGVVARAFDMQSIFGEIFDSVGDRITEISWIAGLLYWFLHCGRPENLAVELCFAAITGSIMVSYVRARAEGAGLKCSGGMMQRPERLIVLGVGTFFGPFTILCGLAILSITAWYTTFERLVRIFMETKVK